MSFIDEYAAALSKATLDANGVRDVKNLEKSLEEAKQKSATVKKLLADCDSDVTHHEAELRVHKEILATALVAAGKVVGVAAPKSPAPGPKKIVWVGNKMVFRTLVDNIVIGTVFSLAYLLYRDGDLAVVIDVAGNRAEAERRLLSVIDPLPLE